MPPHLLFAEEGVVVVVELDGVLVGGFVTGVLVLPLVLVVVFWSSSGRKATELMVIRWSQVPCLVHIAIIIIKKRK